jgi:hypothetical protein
MAGKEVETVKVSESTAGEWGASVNESSPVASLPYLIRLGVLKGVNGSD